MGLLPLGVWGSYPWGYGVLTPGDDGADHDWYRNVITGVCQPVPRHREVNELTARAIIKKLAPRHE